MHLNKSEASVATPAAHVMWPCKQIAERDGVTRQSVSQKVKRLLEKHPDLSVERDHNGRVQRVNVAQYDHILQNYGDSSKAQNRASASVQDAVRDTLDEAKKRQAWLTLERTSLELAAQKKMLVRIEQLEQALDTVGGELAAMLDRLPNRADDLAAAHSQDGMQGLRIGLKKLGIQLRAQAAEILSRISVASDAPDEREESL